MEEYSRKGEPIRTFSIDLSQDQAKAYAERLAILRHPTRQRIIRLLEKYNDKRLCVFEMADVLNITYGAISYQLSRLRDAGLVSAERYKMYLYYSLDTNKLAVFREAASAV